jgi:pimeloyl-ACP methyl ester carboxylesterase
MDRAQRRWLLLGVAAGASAAAAAWFIRKSQSQRLALAGHMDEMTRRALARLGVEAESLFVSVNGVRLHTVVAGPKDGPLVVLLHGFPECWFTWRNQIAPLVEAGYRIVVPDQRGYNLSDKPSGVESYQIDRLTADICELIHVMGRERAIIVAHDWGGAVAWRFAMDYPQMVDKLIVMNAPHPAAFARELSRNGSQRRKSWYMFFFQLPWLPETLLGFDPLFSTRLFFRRTAVRTNAFSDADLMVMAAALAQPGALRTMIHWYRAAFRYPPLHRTQVIEKPTLLIWTEDDVALDKSLTYGLEKRVPHLTVHYIPRCGHWVQNEAPDEVNKQMLAFLQSDR